MTSIADQERRGDFQPDGIVWTGEEILVQNRVDQLGVDLDAGDRGAHGCRAQVTEADGRRADQHDLARDCTVIEAALDDIGRRHIEARIMSMMAQPNEPVDVGRNLQLADAQAFDAPAFRVRDHAVLRALHGDADRLDGERRVEVVTDAQHRRHPAHQTVALGAEGDHAAAGCCLFEDAEIADDSGVAQEKRAGVAVPLDHRCQLIAPVGIGVVDLVGRTDAEDHRHSSNVVRQYGVVVGAVRDGTSKVGSKPAR